MGPRKRFRKSIEKAIDTYKEDFYEFDEEIGFKFLPRQNESYDISIIFQRNDGDVAIEVRGKTSYKGQEYGIVANAFLEEGDLEEFKISRLHYDEYTITEDLWPSRDTMYEKFTEKGFNLPIWIMAMEENSLLWWDTENKGEELESMEETNLQRFKETYDLKKKSSPYRN